MAAADLWFKQRDRPVEFIVVSKFESRVVPLSGSPETIHARTLPDAIHRSRFEHVAILDPVYRFQPMHWHLVDPKDKPEAFRSWSFAPTKAPGSRRLLAFLLVLISRLLLGVRKTRLACGIVTFTKSTQLLIDLQRLAGDSQDGTAELLALAKSRGLTVEEISSGSYQAETEWTKSNSCDPNFPRSRSLKRSIKKSLQFWFCELVFPSRKTISSQKKTGAFSKTMLSAMMLMLAAIVLFANSGYPLFEPDEARNAQLALNILDSGDWISLSLAGEPYNDKPPLLAWLTAISYSVFGVSEWATRLPSALASFLTIGFMIYAGQKLFCFRKAIIGSALLLLAWGFLFLSRFVTMDSLLTLFTTVSTLGIAVAAEKESSSSKSRWLLFAGVAMGLGILVKGPICAVLTLPPITLWLMLSRNISSKNISFILRRVFIPACLVASPWYVLISIHNPNYLYEFIWKHHVQRFSDAFVHSEPFWYYLPIGYLMMFPASILLPRMIRAMTSGKQKYREQRTPAHGLLLLFSLWTFGFFSMSQCKLPSYILPAVPMIALLTGAVLDADLKRATGQRTRIDRLSKRISIGLCLLSALLVGVGWRFGGSSLILVTFAIVALIASVLLVVAYPIKRSTSRHTSWTATFAVGFLFVLLGVNFVVPSIAAKRSILKSLAADQNTKSIPVLYFGRDSFASSIYLPDRTVVYFNGDSLAEAKEWLQRQPQTLFVASDDNAEEIREAFGDSASIKETATRHTFQLSLIPERLAESSGENTTR